MFKKILVASDLTPASSPALDAAIRLGRDLGATLVVLHVIEAPYESRQWFLPGSAEVQALRAALASEEQTLRDKLAQELVRLQAGGSDIQTEVAVSHGVPVDEIVAQATQRGADLIVMGTHGRRGLQHAVMGSVAERVVRTARQPVLTIRGEQ